MSGRRARRHDGADLPADDAAPEVEPSSTPLFDVVERALAAREWRFEPWGDPDGGRPAARLPVRAAHATYLCTLSSYEALHQLCFTATLPTRFPRERLGALCEAVARANWGLVVATLELDLDEGELRARAGLDVEGGTLAVPMVHAMIDASLHALDGYHHAFMRVAYGGMAPADAILEAELGSLGDPPDESAA